MAKNESNFYLELLNHQVKELEKTISEKDKISLNTYNCILAGIVIKMNSIVESCLMDFHSEDFEDIIKIIYQSRQLIVHYSDYRTFNNIEDISLKIIKEFNQVYQHEKDYFKKILSFEDNFEHNVVINVSNNIVYDEFTNCYLFKTDSCEISVSSDKVTRIQDLKKHKDLAYIINCDSSFGCFYRNDRSNYIYKELNGYKDIQEFFSENFNIVNKDYQKHLSCIKDILVNYYRKNNYCAVYVQQESSKSNTIPLFSLTSKVLDSYFNDRIVYKQLLDSRVYLNRGIPEIGFIECDFPNIRKQGKKSLESKISKKDYFIISKCISMFDNLNDEIRKHQHLSDSQKQKLKIAMLVNWIDHTLRNFRDEFISANFDFERLHFSLLSYRNFFAHNVLQAKDSVVKTYIEEFYNIAKGYVSILASLEIKNITNEEKKETYRFISIEKDPNCFYNNKDQQFIKIDNSTYIGDKLFYSTRSSEYDKIIGLIGSERKFNLRGRFYQLKNEDFVIKYYTTKSGKRRSIPVSENNLTVGEEEIMDININDLLEIYCANRGKLEKYDSIPLYGINHRRYLYFYPSSRNDNKEHISDLDQVILDYYQQRFLPYELVQETSLKLVKYGDSYLFSLVDKDNQLIATVIDISLLKKNNLSVDKEGYFTINQTIFDFTRRL